MKQKLFGFKGTILPLAAVEDLSEEWEQSGIYFSVKDGVFEVKYCDKQEREEALDIAKLSVEIWSFQHNTKLTVNFNQFWELKEGDGKILNVGLDDSIGVVDRVRTAHSITHKPSYFFKTRIVNKSDSASFIALQSLIEKSLKNENLKKAIGYYSEEVVDAKRPLYGVYKAVEELKVKVGGWKELATLAGESLSYVTDLAQTTQTERHAQTSGKRLLTDEECRQRAKKLIESYAGSI